ncbi:MAG TPA: hypothetical protein PK263_02785 [bacterium]|nr:hypothetical protein [bacterium]
MKERLDGTETMINTSVYSEADITRFREEIDAKTWGENFADALETRLLLSPELTSELDRCLSGSNLVDLGCGQSALIKLHGAGLGAESPRMKDFPPILKIALRCGAKSYTGVDFSPNVQSMIPIIQQQTAASDFYDSLGTRIEFVFDEMLHFVHSLPDSSRSYCVNGIDPYLIVGKDKQLYDTNWYKALLNELSRTTSRNGLLFGFGSSVLTEGALASVGFTPFAGFNDSYELFAFVKR